MMNKQCKDCIMRGTDCNACESQITDTVVPLKDLIDIESQLQIKVMQLHNDAVFGINHFDKIAGIEYARQILSKYIEEHK